MIIKKSSLDTFLILLTMVSTVFPTFIAKELVSLSLGLIILRVIISNDLLSYIKIKLIILILLIPGIFFTFYFSPENLSRFLGILIVVLGFPFLGFKLKYPSILILSGLIILYLAITQILLLQGNQLILNFRDFAYNYEGSDIHKNYGVTDNIFINAFDFSYWKIRGGGLYSNPNLLAGIVFFYFLIFDITWIYQNYITNTPKKKWKNFVYLLILVITLSVLMQSKSRTFLIGFFIYLIIKNYDLNSFIKFKVTKKFLIILVFSITFLSLFFQKIISGFSEGGSVNIKYSILSNYIENVSTFNLLFGGIHDVWFDAEFGYWIGGVGLFGFFAFIIFYTIVYRFWLHSRPLIVSFLFTSIGTSLFYSLMFASILIPLFIILLSNTNKLLND